MWFIAPGVTCDVYPLNSPPSLTIHRCTRTFLFSKQCCISSQLYCLCFYNFNSLKCIPFSAFFSFGTDKSRPDRNLENKKAVRAQECACLINIASQPRHCEQTRFPGSQIWPFPPHVYSQLDQDSSVEFLIKGLTLRYLFRNSNEYLFCLYSPPSFQNIRSLKCDLEGLQNAATLTSYYVFFF